MIALAVLGEILVVIGVVVLAGPFVSRKVTGRRARPAPPPEEPEERPVTGAFGYDNGVTTGESPGHE